MIIRLSTVINRLWFCVMLLIALSFPLQVYAKSPYPSLLPYLLIGLIFLCRGSRVFRGDVRRNQPNRNVDFVIGIYVSLLILNTVWQTAFGAIKLEEGINAPFVYLLPVVFYWYFSRLASDAEIRSTMMGMIAAALIVGIYFAYDSIVKLALNQVTDYSQAAFDYSVSRAGVSIDDVNDVRISAGYRAQGLLESHSVSGAWTMIGALAALAVIPRRRVILRRLAILFFGVMLLMGLNFTAIVAFAIIMLSFEFSGLLLARRRITSILGNLASFVILVVALVGITVWVAGDSMTEFIVKNLTFQTDLALGAASDDKSYGALVGRYVASYYDHVLIEPLSLLIGDGFTTWGLPKGGDIGFVETLARFGVPYFLLLLFCLVKLLGVAVLRIRAISREAPAEERELDHGSALQFAASVILLVLITEGHYTVWTAKAVLPVVFFSVALYGRYASAPRRGASLRVGAAMTVAGHLENEPWPASQV